VYSIHIHCNELLPTENSILCGESCVSNWICFSCTIRGTAEIITFNLENGESLISLGNMNTPPSAYHVPSFEITSQLTNQLNLSDYDVEENINFNINSQYCTVQNTLLLRHPIKISHCFTWIFVAFLCTMMNFILS